MARHPTTSWLARTPLCSLACLLLAALGSSQCGGAQRIAELVVVVDSDLDFPGEADRIGIVADDGDDAGVFERSRPVADARELPLTLGATETGVPRQVSFVATAYRGDAGVVSRRIAASFERGRSLAVPLTLCGACRGVECGEGETCGELGCERPEAPALSPWTGTAPPRRRCGGCRPGKGLVPLRAFDASKPGYPHVCNAGAILEQDDVPAGLDYSEGSSDPVNIGRSLVGIGATQLPGCIGVDFGSPMRLDPVIVRARAVREDRTACGAPGCVTTNPGNDCERCCMKCSTTEFATSDPTKTPLCKRGGQLIVFAGVRVGVYELVGQRSLGGTFEDHAFEIGKPAQIVVVCRSADGPATADVEVDVVRSGAPCP